MKYWFDIIRRKSAQDSPYHQKILFETEEAGETVATALMKINGNSDIRDEEGNPVPEIAWEAGCLQKKCGACAMLINGQPKLACDTFLKKYKPGSIITLAPLSKFPVIRDLITDRHILFENLKILQLWVRGNGEIPEKNLEDAYDASRCLQCGCCLEACPNFYPGGAFTGAAGYAPQMRLLASCSKEEARQVQKIYMEHIYNGCGKALSCQKVCPAGIDLDRMLSRSNRIAVWHHLQ